MLVREFGHRRFDLSERLEREIGFRSFTATLPDRCPIGQQFFRLGQREALRPFLGPLPFEEKIPHDRNGAGAYVGAFRQRHHLPFLAVEKDTEHTFAFWPVEVRCTDVVLAKRIRLAASFHIVVAEDQATVAREIVITHVLLLAQLGPLARDERRSNNQIVGSVRTVAKAKQPIDRFT